MLDGVIAGIVRSREVPGFRSSSRFRAKALLERCWTGGKPVFTEEESFGVEIDDDGLRSTIEPTREGPCAMDVARSVRLRKKHNELETMKALKC